MGKFVSPDKAEAVQQLMFGDFSKALPRERFLMEEFERYVPQLVGKTPADISTFMDYQRGIYLDGKMPKVGTPVASLNPRFIGSLDQIRFTIPDGDVYTRASVKENGYRFQFHRGSHIMRAYTRQFTPYDLRMFPDLTETLKRLPVMIGDAEIINAAHTHLAGFHRVEMRIPAQGGYWPKQGTEKIDDELLMAYLRDNELFHEWGVVLPDMRLTLAFHGLFAISHPKKWEEPLEVQEKHMVSLCDIPTDYDAIDHMLNKLREYCTLHNLNARVVERKPVTSRKELEEYIALKDVECLEGVCVVQSGWKNGMPMIMGHSVKVKKYETVDTAVLGLYLGDTTQGLVAENVTGVLVGLYDQSLKRYLPATKLNLDPLGVQVKNTEQKDRLTRLRDELVNLVLKHEQYDDGVITLLDTFLMQGVNVLQYLSPELAAQRDQIMTMINSMPRGKDVVSLYELYATKADEYDKRSSQKGARCKTQTEQFLVTFAGIFKIIRQLKPSGQRRFLTYFSKMRDIKTTSAKLVRPQHVVNPYVEPIIIETQVFDLTWGTSPYPAGFHSWYGHSFRFNNAYPERIRFDKSSVTDYPTIYDLARRNTPRTSRRPYRKHVPRKA